MDNRIKEILVQKGMTAVNPANKIGLSNVSIYNIINRRQDASANTLASTVEELEGIVQNIKEEKL